jgi:DNA-binding transcriptional LysR family regulator
MELHHLRAFGAVGGTLNLTEVARQLHIAQPAVSRKIHRLKSELGIQVFKRERGRLRFTAVGQNFHHDSGVILSLIDETLAHYKSGGGSDKSR